ncbi:Rv2175c family DNA-binding protein [Rothia terrae]|uniref:Rv2175c family DNA-binding protein n=1 Tax=Rothia terrae TaxID=396015 RepID=UPI0031D9A8F2
MNENISELFELVGEWTTIPDIAEALDLKVTKVHALITDGQLIALRDPETNVRKIPALFISDTRVLDPLPGTLQVLKDAGFSDEEAIKWLYTEDDSLPGRPIDALIDGRKTEIRRRAQAMAW